MKAKLRKKAKKHEYFSKAVDFKPQKGIMYSDFIGKKRGLGKKKKVWLKTANSRIKKNPTEYNKYKTVVNLIDDTRSDGVYYGADYGQRRTLKEEYPRF